MPPSRRSLWLKRALAALAAVALLLGGAAAVGYRTLRASLAQLDGTATLAGLSAPVTVERDDLGVPTIRAASRLDASRALGYVHAQERFFQMDLLRRRAAGELSELAGPGTLDTDKATRRHRFRDVAARALAGLPREQRAHIGAYATGVNAGLDALGSYPFEYHVLRAEPRPWEPEDTLLASYAMFLTLHGRQWERESALGLMRDRLPPELFAFLTPTGTEWDAPLVGEAVRQPEMPGPEVLNLRTTPSADAAGVAGAEPRPDVAGSNNWAVAGTRTAHGGALLANDMHLGIGVPNTWYRASLVWPDDNGASQRVTGVTLPGTPAIIAGSNGSLAWGFTNSEGDWVSLVEVQVDPDDSERYLTADGPRRFGRHAEKVRVRGERDVEIVVTTTVWGPVIDHDHRGRPRALRWTAHEPEALNVDLLRMERAKQVDEALRIAAGTGMPPQNFVCADSRGRIGWTIAGRIPRRVGFDGRLPASWADARRGWNGWLTPEEHPRLVDPPVGVLWTANARTVDGEALAKLGHGGYALGARARQIRDGLLALAEPISEGQMLALQLDDRALFLDRWQRLLLETLEAAPGSARHSELRALVAAWGARAEVDSVGYRAVRAFRLEVARLALGPLTAACRQLDPGFRYVGRFRQQEGPLWALVTRRPRHLLDARFEGWESLLQAAADGAIESLLSDGAKLGERTWGELNTSRIRHPLGRALPGFGRWLDMPPRPLPGDMFMPRVQRPASGASERLVVAPGREAQGYFHMPGGQSGHPLSPHYRRGHTAWERGDPTPFLPGPAVHTLTLVPS